MKMQQRTIAAVFLEDKVKRAWHAGNLCWTEERVLLGRVEQAVAAVESASALDRRRVAKDVRASGCLEIHDRLERCASAREHWLTVLVMLVFAAHVKEAWDRRVRGTWDAVTPASGSGGSMRVVIVPVVVVVLAVVVLSR